MRIKYFTKIIFNEAADAHKMQNCEVVVDALNFFYSLYTLSGLQSEYGCESDKYAQYLRSYLGKFKEANVKCYFFFKGGHEDPSRMWNKNKQDKSQQFEMGKTIIKDVVDIKPLIFTNEIHIQVLEEMDFDYVVCQYESKRECVAFAQKRKCAILGNNIEYGFSGVPYIPANNFSQEFDIAQCRVFTLDNFMRKFKINKEELAIFIVLTDEYIFPENQFQKLIEAKNIYPLPNHFKLYDILKWISRVKSQCALNDIFRYVTPEVKKTFLKRIKEVMAFIGRQEKPGLPSQYLENKMNLLFVKNDPRWFEKGVVTNAVAIPYVNLYRWNKCPGSWSNADNDAPDALLISLDIIKYALGLLSNFSKNGLKFVHETSTFTMDETSVKMSSHFRKPNYTAIESPFENGWSQLRSLGFFEHFLTETLPMFDFTILERVPKDARLLFIALVYFSHKNGKRGFHFINEVCSVLLSYMVVNILSELECTDPVDRGHASGSVLDTTTKDSIEDQDKVIAKRNLAKFLDQVPEVKVDHRRIHTMVEFQYCLLHLNFLNNLCGRPYQSTVYSKTFNGTLVHRILFSLEKQNVDTLAFLENKLNKAPTVLAFWNRLIGDFKEIYYK